jgi:8-oxo-dGTP pyrophosphatase MutT (NUDIX family)
VPSAPLGTGDDHHLTLGAATTRYDKGPLLKNHVRPIAIAIIKRRDPSGAEAILVIEGHNPHTGETFYRPLGGGIELGETGVQTVRRELYEEAGLELGDVCYLATLENIFTYGGEIGHEIVMVYSAQLAKSATQAYEQDEIQCVEDNGAPFLARWMPLSRFGDGGPALYPNGLLDSI